jgi:hypothetical protein
MHINLIVRRFLSLYLESRATPGNSASIIYFKCFILMTGLFTQLRHISIFTGSLFKTQQNIHHDTKIHIYTIEGHNTINDDYNNILTHLSTDIYRCNTTFETFGIILGFHIQVYCVGFAEGNNL